MEQRYLIKIGQQVIGEFSFVEVQQQVRTGKLTRLHRVSTDGGQTWDSIQRVAEFQIALNNSDQRDAEKGIHQQPAEQRQPELQKKSQPQHEQWYITMASGEQVGQKYGPFTKEEVANWLQQGRVSAADLVWTENFDDWKPVYMVFETVNVDSAPRKELPGFVKTIFRTGVRTETKKKVPKEQQSWSIISIASATFSFTWLGGLGSVAGIILAIIGLFEVLSSKGYKRGVVPCLVGLTLGVMGVALSYFLFFSGP